MELKPGYKQTEVGMTPEDWEVKSLGQISRPVRGGSPRPAGDPRYFNGSFIPWLTVAGLTNIPESQLVVSETESCLTREGALHSRTLEQGTLIISNSGATLGVAKILGMRCCANDGIAALLNLSKDIYAPFLTHYINTKTEYLRDVVATGNGQPNLNTTLIANVKFCYPPTKAEQKAIADALSDADALIESLEQLIAKKRDIKQGAMQKLFIKKEADVIRSLAEISTLKGRIGWQGLKQAEFTTNSDEPFLITGMNFKDGAIRWDEVYHVSEERYEIAKEIQLKTGDVLMTKDGTIGKVLYIDVIPYPGKASLNSHLLVFRPIRESYFPKYLYYQLLSKRFTDFIELSKSGSTFFGISQAAVGRYPVLLPNLSEQIKIATLLSDMDAEIDMVETKLAKARQLKQGMMQQLLTGRIRLI